MVDCSMTRGVVTFVWTSRPDTMRVLITDSATVCDASRYVRTQAGPSIPNGIIVRGAGSDPALPFHYLPESVRLNEATIEVCDSKLLRTPADVDEFFVGITGRADSPSAQYCPWSARPVRVAPAP